MRFPIAALLFVIASFIFFVLYATGEKLLDSMVTALLPTAPTEAAAIINNIQTAFGIIAALFFCVGIILIFVLDSLADEEEYYWEESYR